MRRTTSLILLISAISLSGCSETRIDASTEESYRNSLVAVVESLDKEQRELFVNAVGAVMMRSAFSGDDGRATLDGMTADEVISLARKLTDDEIEHARIKAEIDAKLEAEWEAGKEAREREAERLYGK